MRHKPMKNIEEKMHWPFQTLNKFIFHPLLHLQNSLVHTKLWEVLTCQTSFVSLCSLKVFIDHIPNPRHVLLLLSYQLFTRSEQIHLCNLAEAERGGKNSSPSECQENESPTGSSIMAPAALQRSWLVVNSHTVDGKELVKLFTLPYWAAPGTHF